MNHATERIDVGNAIEELSQLSFAEVLKGNPAGSVGEDFITVPLSASEFGRRKLISDPAGPLVEADLAFLRLLGAGQRSDVARGIGPKIERLVKTIAARVESHPTSLSEAVPILEFLARRYPLAWLDVATLYEECGDSNRLGDALRCIRAFLEDAPHDRRYPAWRRLARVCALRGDVNGEVHALVESCKCPGVQLPEISRVANVVNTMLGDGRLERLGTEGRHYIRQMVAMMEAHYRDANADDLSRLAWLALYLGDTETAKQVVSRALVMDFYNPHCRKLAVRLQLL